MYDYRTEVKELLEMTGASQNELCLTAKAIKVILKIAQVKEVPPVPTNDTTEITAKKTEPQTAEQVPDKQVLKPTTPPIKTEKVKIDRTLQTLQTLLSTRGENEALTNWIKRDPKIYDQLFELVMVYRVSTRRKGFKAYNKQKHELKFNEFVRNQFKPKNGDALVVSNSHTKTPRIIKVIHQPENEYHQNTVTFDQGVVELDENQRLVVQKDVAGNPLLVDEKPFSYQLTPHSKAQVGSVVRLRWYKDKVGQRQNEDLALAWIYPKQTVNRIPATPLKKTGLTKVKYQPTIEFDLAGATVGIVVGRELYHDKYAAIVQAHGGDLLMVDAFYHRRNPEVYFSRRLSQADYVVMVQNQSKHNTSYALAKIKEQFKGFAIAKNLTGLQVEQAIYRAFEGLPAFVDQTVSAQRSAII
ncbi:hypothetical protein [Ligilactobacillus apodemi]|nr:hypothetical protein [Ligilactobacillus apodemi]MCR1901150.1 hypothetical protein [Ligilactobacillus apodemi]